MLQWYYLNCATLALTAPCSSLERALTSLNKLARELCFAPALLELEVEAEAEVELDRDRISLLAC